MTPSKQLPLAGKDHVTTLAKLFGSKSNLARICDVHRTAITRWTRDGEVPMHHHTRIKREAWVKAAGMTDTVEAQTFASEVMKCLPSTVCPCCNRVI